MTFKDLHFAFFLSFTACEFISKADIVFLLDSSSSEGAVNFHRQLDFVSRVVNDFQIGAAKVQIGVVTFSDSPVKEFGLNQYGAKSSLLTAIQQIGYLQGTTHTESALKFAREEMFTAADGARDDAKHYVIILTDGVSSNTNETIAQANMLKQQGVEVIAVGIGSNVNKEEINAMASDLNHVFTVSNFSALRTIREDIKKAACEGIPK